MGLQGAAQCYVSGWESQEFCCNGYMPFGLPLSVGLLINNDSIAVGICIHGIIFTLTLNGEYECRL